MNQGNHPYAEIDGMGYMFWNRQGMTLLTFGDATVIGSDQNTTLIARGNGDVTFLAGDGNNTAYGAGGNDVFIGGEGYNRFFGGAGDDLLVGGNGINNLNGGAGNDTISFGEWDQVSGGSGADHFMFSMKTTANQFFNIDPQYAFVRDLNFAEGDTLDLTMCPEINRGNIVVKGDALMVYTAHGPIDIEGVGNQVTLVGGIDAAIHMGMLSVAGGDFGGKG